MNDFMPSQEYTDFMESLQPNLSGEYLTKLEIEPDTVLILRPPPDSSTENMVQAMRAIKAVIKNKTGMEPGLLIVAQDTELVAMGVETLIMLRHEIDASLLYMQSKFAGEKGN